MNHLLGQKQIHDLFSRIRSALPANIKCYLVGGAVRDLMMDRPIHDLDFIIQSPGKVITLSRQVARALDADFYPLDTERDTARLLINQPGEPRLNLDFAAMRGADIDQDLAARDFTINAMALDLQFPDQVIDPLSGARDIVDKILRSCSEESFLDDPIRILRGVRFAVQNDYRILPETLKLMRQALPGLEKVSPERLRDEIFRLLDLPAPDLALRVIEKLGILPYTFPELPSLIGVKQSSPHTLDVWNHTLSVLQKMRQVLHVLNPGTDLDEKGNLVSSWISIRLGRYRKEIVDHFSKSLNPERSMQSLLYLSALYHDAGKPETQTFGANGTIHFYKHEKISREIIENRARLLRLSNSEIDHVSSIVAGHLRPLMLSQSGEKPGRRSIYRFWRDLDEAGVDICLLSIADLLGTYGTTIKTENLINHLDTIRLLLDAWWLQRQEQVNPPVIINGTQVMEELHLSPGPVIGQILEAIRQAQVDGTVTNYSEAVEYARYQLENPDKDL